MSTTTGATDTPPLQTVGDAAGSALERARDYINRTAEKITAESYPEEAQEGVAPPVTKPEESTQPENREASDTTTDTETADGNTEIQEGEEGDSSEAESVTESADQGESGESTEAESEDGTAFEVPPEIQESINKRIGKEVAKTKAEKEARESAETKLKELESQLEVARQNGSPRVVSAVQPMADVASLSELNKKRVDAQATRDEVMDLLESVEDAPEEVEQKLRAANIICKNENGEEDYSPKRMRRTLRQINSNIRTTLDRHIPEREAFIKTESEFKARIEKELPDLSNPSSETSKLFRSITEAFPEMKLNPRWPILAAGQTLFVQSLQKTKQANGTAKPKPTPPKIPAKPKAAPVVTGKKDAQTADLHARMLTGDPDARVQLIEEMLKD